MEEHGLSAYVAASTSPSLAGGVLDSPSLRRAASLDEGEALRQRRVPSHGSMEGRGGLSTVREGSSLSRSLAASPRQPLPCSPPPPRVYVVRSVHSATAD